MNQIISRALCGLLLTVLVTTGHTQALADVRQQLQNRLEQQLKFDAEREADWQAQVSAVGAQLSRDDAALRRLTRELETLRETVASLRSRSAALETRVAGARAANADLLSAASLAAAEVTGERRRGLLHLGKAPALISADTAPVAALEAVWLALLDDAVAGRNFTTYTAEVTSTDGERTQREVLRAGDIAMFESGWLLANSATPASFQRLPRGGLFTPAPRLERDAELLHLPIDLSGGRLTAAAAKSPGVREQLAASGAIGKLIVLLGFIGAGLVVWQLWSLPRSVTQAESRLLDIANDTRRATRARRTDLLLSLTRRRAARGRLGLQLIVAAAPLLGLLGTVTGMIVALGQLSLYGSSDPRAMAGGISQALLTTLMGLAVALPLLPWLVWFRRRARRRLALLEATARSLVAAAPTAVRPPEIHRIEPDPASSFDEHRCGCLAQQQQRQLSAQACSG